MPMFDDDTLEDIRSGAALAVAAGREMGMDDAAIRARVLRDTEGAADDEGADPWEAEEHSAAWARALDEAIAAPR